MDPFSGIVAFALILVALPAVVTVILRWRFRDSTVRRRVFTRRVLPPFLLYYAVIALNEVCRFTLSAFLSHNFGELHFFGCVLILAAPAASTWMRSIHQRPAVACAVPGMRERVGDAALLTARTTP